MPQTELSKATQLLIEAAPSATGAILGFIGHALVKDDPRMNKKRFVGGVMLSAFTGGCVCIILEQMGFPPPVASVVASAIGSSGIKGYEWLLQHSKESAGNKK